MTKRQKTALITGASSGIGFATAIEFAKRGYQVFAGARRLEPMEPLAKEYGITILQLDVSSTQSILKAKEIISDKTGGYLDILYNNAGQSCTFPALDTTDVAFKQCYEVNVFGPMRVVREFGPLVINAQGTIGFTGSVSGIIPFPLSTTYSSSKAAIHQYASGLRVEMKPFNVKVINIITGGVGTNIADTRPLPTDSIYNIPEMTAALAERQLMARNNNPISAEHYAKKVASDFENLSMIGPLNLYRGRMASVLRFVSVWCPRFILELILIRKFKLVGVFNILRAKYSKEHIE